ncbi:MAG: CubicO group peptidase (beta-lactamase class C family) [Pseudohongiellaceae bacterium]|jgi:CubicO group peptidase (beta-lactamase class C family)
MIRKITFGLAGFLILLTVAASIAGFPPAFILSAPGVATGIGSKLLCSSQFVSGFSAEQSFDDLVQYSPLLDFLDVSTDEDSKVVKTSFLGISTKTASYISGLGCSVDYSGYTQRQELKTQSSFISNESWPLGNKVAGLQPGMQALLESQVIRDNVAGLNTRALLVVHNGAILGEAYAQGADSATPLLGWSMAKSLTSVMLGNLELRGLLNLDASPEFSEWLEDDRSEIKITDLLTMSDGLDFSEQYNPGDDATTMLFTSPSASDFTIARPLAHEPGARFNYSSGTANVLSRIYLDVLGGPQQSYDDYKTNIAGPLGFQNAVFEVDASGAFFGSSYLYASARDWARLGQLMVNGGAINGREIVTQDWIDRATAPNTTKNEKAYGYQWWLNRGNEDLRWPDIPNDAYAAQGNRQQNMMIVPSKNLVIVRLGWTAGRYPINQNFSEIIAVL